MSVKNQTINRGAEDMASAISGAIEMYDLSSYDSETRDAVYKQAIMRLHFTDPNFIRFAQSSDIKEFQNRIQPLWSDIVTWNDDGRFPRISLDLKIV